MSPMRPSSAISDYSSPYLPWPAPEPPQQYLPYQQQMRYRGQQSSTPHAPSSHNALVQHPSGPHTGPNGGAHTSAHVHGGTHGGVSSYAGSMSLASQAALLSSHPTQMMHAHHSSHSQTSPQSVSMSSSAGGNGLYKRQASAAPIMRRNGFSSASPSRRLKVDRITTTSQLADPPFGRQVCTHIELLEMSQMDTDGYYKRICRVELSVDARLDF